jgi:DMSO reductase family type II enzyme heme b subunit
MTPSTAEVRVQAITNGSDVAFRLHWLDATVDDQTGPGRMVDSCAIQLPQKIEKDAPAPQMGEAGRPVEITMWRADWQAYVNGRGDTIRDIYPNAAVDHYPFDAHSLEKGSAEQAEMAKRYAPAAVVGNRRVGPRKTPVEDLTASGPGSLSPNASGNSNGRGERTKDGWAVVIQRRLPESLSPKVRSQIAFAVWEG